MADPAVPAKLKSGNREWWITLLLSIVLRGLLLTLRIRIEDRARLSASRAGGPFILAFWHNRMLLVPPVWQRLFAPFRRAQGLALSSASGDGELVAQFVKRFGVGSVRGSATRRGARALRELASLMRQGHDVAVTPDGSRGPVYEIKGGLVLLAQLTGCPVLPISFEYERSWRLKGWDRFIIPKPFSRVLLRVGEPHLIPRTSGEAAFEAERVRCQAAMLSLVDER